MVWRVAVGKSSPKELGNPCENQNVKNLTSNVMKIPIGKIARTFDYTSLQCFLLYRPMVMTRKKNVTTLHVHVCPRKLSLIRLTVSKKTVLRTDDKRRTRLLPLPLFKQSNRANSLQIKMYYEPCTPENFR